MAGEERMVERVARAMYEATPFKQTNGGFEEQSEPYRAMCRFLAKAAIAAMREPTDDMLRATGGECAKWAPGAWKTMVDAALVEAGDGR